MPATSFSEYNDKPNPVSLKIADGSKARNGWKEGRGLVCARQIAAGLLIRGDMDGME